MAARSTIFDGQRYCTAFCERLLPLEWFYPSGNGYVNTWCRDCSRIKARERYRRKYRNNRAFRKAERQRTHERYHGDPEYRERMLVCGRKRKAAA